MSTDTRPLWTCDRCYKSERSGDRPKDWWRITINSGRPTRSLDLCFTCVCVIDKALREVTASVATREAQAS